MLISSVLNAIPEHSSGPRMRGGAFHRYLVRQVCEVLRAAGFDTRLEYPRRLTDGRIDFVDIFAARDTHRLACEIETTPRYVRVNIAKALALGLPVFVVVPSRRVRVAVQRQCERHFAGADHGRFWILLPDEVAQGLSECFPGFSGGE